MMTNSTLLRKHSIRMAAAISTFMLTASFCFAEKITFSADSMVGNASEKSDYTRLEGSATVKTDTMEIAADMIELKGDDFRYIVASGTITGSITDSKLDFTCDKLTYDRDTKIATLENTVHLKDNGHDVSADAQLIEYNQNTEIAVMQIGVTLKQKDNTCTSAYAIYRKEAQLLDMSGNPKIVQGDNTFRAQTITLNLDTQEITLDGRVQGSVTSKKNSTSTDKPKDEAGTDSASADGTTAEGTSTDDSTKTTDSEGEATKSDAAKTTDTTAKDSAATTVTTTDTSAGATATNSKKEASTPSSTTGASKE